MPLTGFKSKGNLQPSFSFYILDMVLMADSLNGLSKEDILSGKSSDDSLGRTKNPDIDKILQETSEGLAHLSIQWPDYANNYDMNVLEILKLVQVGRQWFVFKIHLELAKFQKTA